MDETYGYLSLLFLLGVARTKENLEEVAAWITAQKENLSEEELTSLREAYRDVKQELKHGELS